MDIKKEREAFEESFKIKWEIGHYILKMVKFIEDSQDYAPVNAIKQMSDEYYWVLALNTGWWAWQAAKSQAVPEGFVLVNKKDLVKVLNCVTDDWLVDTDSFEEFKKIESLVQDEVNAIIEAQESSNG